MGLPPGRNICGEGSPRLTQEVFTVMFSDREALKELNGHVAKLIKGLKVADYPNLLKADGKVARCSSWPSWLRKGLFYRDKGRCAICLSNLSGIDAAGTDVAIDHLVPLNLGGTNDPTNLQILCRDCNGKKGGSQATTSKLSAPLLGRPSTPPNECLSQQRVGVIDVRRCYRLYLS